MKAGLAPVAPAIALALLAGCAGMAVQGREARGPLEEEPAVRVGPPPAGRPGSEVRFDTEPEGAELLLDNRLRGTTPLLIASLEPGLYKVEVRKPGYRAVTEWIQHAGPGARYTLTLARLTGRLTVGVTPASARVSVGGSPLEPGSYELPAGDYRVVASAFGYLDRERVVQVPADSSVSVELSLDEAPFAARLLRASPPRIAPAGAGDRGLVRLDFEVTGPAAGALHVLSASGAEVYGAAVEARDGPQGSVAWDGRGQGGTPLPEGSYLLRLDLRSARGEQARIEAAVVVARRSLALLSSQGSGVSGLQYVATPDTAPQGAGAFTLTPLLALAPSTGGEVVDSAPIAVAVRQGLPAGLEVDAAAAVFLVDKTPLPFLVSAGLKAALPPPASILSLAATARASLQSGSGSDPFTAFTGLGLGLAAALESGPLVLVFEPELTLSPWRVTGDSTYDDDPALYAWAYLRAGMAARLRRLTVGVSVAARTEPFSEGPALGLPVAVGAEAHWSAPGDRLVVTLQAGTQIDAGALERLLAGVAFGYRY